jgi:hypothetical protein
MYFDQWKRLLDEEVIAELITFGEDHVDLLADGKPAKASGDVSPKDRMVTLGPAEAKLLDEAIAAAKAAGDFDRAVTYATLKATAAQNKGKLVVEDMIQVFNLKPAR